MATVGESSIVLPSFQCRNCGRAISEFYFSKTGKCASCIQGDNQTEGLERIYTVTVYLPDEDRQDGEIVGDISSFSNRIYEAKSGNHVSEMAGVLKYGIREFENLNTSDLIVYPPSGEGGANHMKDIANRLSKSVGIPAADITEKLEDYPSQKSTSSEEERITNLQGKIGISTSLPEQIDLDEVKRAVVVDDVVVTGSTMSNTAQALKQNGVSEVYGLGIARNEALNHLIEYAEVIQET